MKRILITLCYVLVSQTIFAQKPLDDKQPSFGLNLMDTSDAIKLWKDKKMPSKSAPKKGLLIASMIVGSEAQKAGLQALDLLDSVEGIQVRTVDKLQNLIDAKSPGDSVEYQIRRLDARGNWQPIKGTLKLGSERTAYYSQIAATGSEVKRTIRAHHSWFNDRRDYISPIIFADSDTVDLYVEVSIDSESALLPRKLVVRAGEKTCEVDLGLLKASTDIYTRGSSARVYESVTVKCPNDLAEMIRSATTLKVRVDGSKVYTEFTPTEVDRDAMRVAVAVYDDMVLTGNRDLTLGGRVKK